MNCLLLSSTSWRWEDLRFISWSMLILPTLAPPCPHLVPVTLHTHSFPRVFTRAWFQASSSQIYWQRYRISDWWEHWCQVAHLIFLWMVAVTSSESSEEGDTWSCTLPLTLIYHLLEPCPNVLVQIVLEKGDGPYCSMQDSWPAQRALNSVRISLPLFLYTKWTHDHI